MNATPTVGGRAWESVLLRIESELLSGALKPGDHLPSERQLASELQIGRSSVREALRVLEVLGLIRTQTGSGPSAGAVIIAKPGGGMSALMRLQVAANGFPVSDVVGMRLILETAVCDELARAGGDLANASELLDAMDRDDISPEAFLALDQQFHLELAEASGNQVVTATMAGLRSSIEGYVLEGLAAIQDWTSTAARLRAEHRHVVEAITARDPALAQTRMRDHITGYYSQTKLGG